MGAKSLTVLLLVLSLEGLLAAHPAMAGNVLAVAEGSSFKFIDLSGQVLATLPVSSTAQDLSVSSDGTRIVYSVAGAYGGSYVLWLYDTVTRSHTRLLSQDWSQTLAWLPGSSSQFVYGGSGGKLLVYDVNARTSALWQNNETILSSFGLSVYRGGIAWDDSGQTALVRIGGASAGGDVVLRGQMCDAAASHHLCDLRAFSPLNGGSTSWANVSYAPALTPDGAFGYYVRRINWSEHRLVRKSLSTGTETVIITTNNYNNGMGAVAAPNGSQVAVLSPATGSKSNVWICGTSPGSCTTIYAGSAVLNALIAPPVEGPFAEWLGLDTTVRYTTTFTPTADGFRFVNPPVRVPFVNAEILGHCTGMSYAALYYWYLGFDPYPGVNEPPLLHPQWAYISWLQWWKFAGEGFGHIVLTLLERAQESESVRISYEAIRGAIEKTGRPAPILLATDSDILLVHTVLAYGITDTGNRKIIDIYDPNWPQVGSGRSCSEDGGPPRIVVEVIDGVWRMEGHTCSTTWTRFGPASPLFDVEDLPLAYVLHSPGVLSVTDPAGKVVTESRSDVHGARYWREDLDGDGSEEQIVAFAAPVPGSYAVSVVPIAGSNPVETFSIETIHFGASGWLAQDVAIGTGQPWSHNDVVTAAPPAVPPIPLVDYLAEGATSSLFDTRLALLNPTSGDATVTLTFQRDAGSPITSTVQVPARGRVTVNPKVIPGLEDAAFATKVESSQFLVAERTMSWNPSDAYGAHAETAVSSPAPTWYFAEGATHGTFNLFYLLQNPNEEPAEVRVRYLRPSGAPLEKTYTLAPNSRTNIWVDYEEFAELGRALASTDVSAVIEALSGQPVIAERAMYADVPGQTYGAGHNSAGITAPATQWFLAEGATGSFFDLFVLIANPTSTVAQIEATYLLPDGTTIVKPYTVGPFSRFNIWVDYEDGRLADTAVSTTVRVVNDVPVIVERAMWWPGPSPATWYEAHSSAGATTTGTRWALAEGEVDTARNLETYILVANTSTVPADVKVTLLFEDGTSAEKTYPRIPARSRFNVPVGHFFAEAAGKRFGAIVDSQGTPPAQIVVERAMYWDAAGQRWAAGTNALATKLQ